VLQECYKCVTRVSQESHKGVTRVSQEFYKNVTRVLQECYNTGKKGRVEGKHNTNTHLVRCEVREVYRGRL
jgi:hypothetical protein